MSSADMSSSRLLLNRRMVVENIATLFSGSAVAQGFTALALLFTARQLGPGAYGQYAVSVALVSFTGILFNLGLDVWLMREGGREPERLEERAGSVLAIKGGLGFLWVLLWWIFAPLIASSVFPVELLQLSALVVWLDRMFMTVLAVFKASLKNRITSVLDIVSDGLWFLGTLMLIGANVQAASLYFWLRAGVLSGMFLIALFVVLRVISLSASRGMVREALRSAMPYASSEFFMWIYMRFDVLIIGFALGDDAVGLYSPAVSLVNALFLIPAAVYAVIVPVLSNLFAYHTNQAWKTAFRSVGLLTVMGLGLMVSLFLGAPFLVSLLGEKFAASLEILKILSWILWLHSISFGMAAILVAVNLQKKRSTIQAYAVVFNIVCNVFVVKWLGIRGVALVYVLTEVVLMVGYAWVAMREAQRHFLHRNTQEVAL